MTTTYLATRNVRELLGIYDVPLVGGKNASLGKVVRNLASQSVNALRGFPV
jgi:phosphoenolpyruvate synthase/pyruvate phosphate dikinase